MLVSCIQTNPQENLDTNLESIVKQIHKAKKSGAQVVVLPEMYSFMGRESERKLSKSNLNEGPFAILKSLAKDLDIFLISGSHSESIEKNSEKVFNTSVAYNNKGEIISIYRKLHLFNLVDIEGNKLYCESDVFEVGEAPKAFEIFIDGKNWKALTIICYDLRFPEIIRTQKENIDILFVPAAFTWQTGKDHWEILLRARAIENQCYVVACNQTGFYANDQKRNYGNSMIIDPWGNVLSRLGDECGILSEVLSKDAISESRQRLPALHDRKIKFQ